MSTPLDPRLFQEPVPTPSEKALWDQFLDEYMKDFNPFDACLRVGFSELFAIEYSKNLMAKPYIKQEIMRRKSEVGAEKDEDKIARHKALIEATLLETMQNGQPATRVAAAKTLAGIHGLDQAPDRSGDAISNLVDELKTVATLLPD